MPKPLIVARYFADEQAAIDAQQAELESVTAQLTELEEEHGCEDGAFLELENINKGEVSKRHQDIKADPEYASETKVLQQWLTFSKQEAALKKAIKEAEVALDQLAHDNPELSEDEIKTLVVDDKWLTNLEGATRGEMDRISQALTRRVKELVDRYETPLPKMTSRVTGLEEKVNAHLQRMGFAWN